MVQLTDIAYNLTDSSQKQLFLSLEYSGNLFFDRKMKSIDVLTIIINKNLPKKKKTNNNKHNPNKQINNVHVSQRTQ